MIKTGLDILREDGFSQLSGKRVGVLANPASCDSNLDHIFELVHEVGLLKAIFTPQHGIHGATQANMIEWEGFPRHPKYGCPVFSLYGEHRRPLPRWVDSIDVLVVDLQDVGSRYYTYIWTMALCMEAVSERGKDIWILDRPNPIGGDKVEGPLLDMEDRSFVGLYSLPPRHGMTIGEIAEYINTEFYIGANLTVIEMEGWRRDMLFPETGLPWIMPSPNMPTVDTALVYPGQCLLEGTNISEGRGTTRPFEIWGAPYPGIEGLDLSSLPGMNMRPVSFQPTFDKWKGQDISGFQIHITDVDLFMPFRTTMEILIKCRDLEGFELLPPPYEYERVKSPLHILIGRGDVFDAFRKGAEYNELEGMWSVGLTDWMEMREEYLRY